ncbi:MAG TPA: nuclear transport factor 2 family protein [Candidatus Limnocylindrales bacterium]|nr:nuclear transport factor 2 family protein [Candidatus Limnocylindrales bacterium]
MTDIDDGTLATITGLEDEMQAALVAADLGWFESHWSSDALYVHMSGRVDSRADFVERLRSREHVHVSREMGDVRIRRFGDAVIVTGWAKSDLIVRGTAKTYDTRFTRVYAREVDHWLMVTSQSGAHTTGS